MYRINFDRSTDCLVIHVAGFWKPEDVQAFSESLEAECRAARNHSPSYNVIVHSLDFPVQANDVADLMTDMVARCIQLTEGFAALVVASHLNKMQVQRTMNHPRVRPFLSEADARVWLAEMSARRAGH